MLFSASVCSGVLEPTGVGAEAEAAVAAAMAATAFVDTVVLVLATAFVETAALTAPATAGLVTGLDDWHPTSSVEVTNMIGMILRINRAI